ncbi:DUF3836 domain-containing protein [Bacteroides sp.]|uniref:DUF3836 domain-containing protein n=1 Tax=Bacteroides sp. TaxID=29523 RepID=UPI002616744E|nr:DUF3836 domain-containing protein [Bacteroides sp.]
MKTNLISKAVVMLAVVMASVMNFSASAVNPTQYVTNNEMTGEVMTAKNIFRNEDGHLFRHLRYTYTYDNENRVTSKEASKWNSEKEAWVPYFKLDVEYSDNEVELNYACWNNKSNAYDSNVQKTVYELNNSNVNMMLASTK